MSSCENQQYPGDFLIDTLSTSLFTYLHCRNRQLSMSVFLYGVCFIWIFVRHAFSLYLRIEALLLSYFSQFYDHLETLLLNLHNFLSTKKWNLFFKQLGSQLTQIFRRKSKQDSDYCCPHRAATYFCLEGVWERHLWGSLFRSLQVCFAVLPVPSPRRVAPNAAKWNV